MSTEFDMAIYVNQGGRDIRRRLGEPIQPVPRNGRMPYQQILGRRQSRCTKPLDQERAERGTLELLETRHEDNPGIL